FAPLDGGLLALRGHLMDGQLGAIMALHEPRTLFGGRTLERFLPALAPYDLACARFAEREAREEAVTTLEDVTQRVHGEYVRKLGELEGRLRTAAAASFVERAGTESGVADGGPDGDGQLLALSQSAAKSEEE